MSLGRKPLVALLVLCLGGSALFAYLGLTAGADAPPLAVVEGERSPFRGGQLPPELAGAPAPTFSHTDARSGESFGTADLSGSPYALTFLFTDCPDVCPLIGQELREALELLGPRADDVGVVAVSVDPEGDTREAVQAWLRSHDLPANFRYLIGSEEELRPTWRAYFTAPQAADAVESRHTASIWLVDSDGRLRTKFSGGVPVPPADIAHDLELLLEDAGRRSS